MKEEKFPYKFNEIFIEEEISQYGLKASRINKLKQWQFPVPESVFLSGALTEKIINDGEIPLDILTFFKNEFVSLRTSPVAGAFENKIPCLYLGLNDETYKILVKRIGVNQAHLIYIQFLINFAVGVFNIEAQAFKNLDKLNSGSVVKSKTIEDLGQLDIVEKYREIIGSETGKQVPSKLSDQIRLVLIAVYKAWLSPTQKILREVSGIPENERLPIVLQRMVIDKGSKEWKLIRAKNFDDHTGMSKYLYFSSEDNIFYEEKNNEIPKRRSYIEATDNKKRLIVSKDLDEKTINLIKTLSQKVKVPFKLSLMPEGSEIFLIGYQEVSLPPKKLVEFVVSSVENGLMEIETGLLMIEPATLDVFLHPSVSDSQELVSDLKGVAASPGAATGRLAMSTSKVLEYRASELDAILVKKETIADDVKNFLIFL